VNYGENYSNKKITEIGIAETERIQAIGKFGLDMLYAQIKL